MYEKTNREPWLAALLSLMVSGAGQAYERRFIPGALFFAGAAASMVACLAAAVRGELAVSAGLLLVPLALKLASLLDAFFSVRRSNEVSFEERRKENKDPWCAVFLSYIVPGVGHIYLKKAALGVLFLAVNFIFLPLLSFAIPSKTGAVFFGELLAGALIGFVSWHVYRTSGDNPAGLRLASVLAGVMVALHIVTAGSALAISTRVIKAYSLPTGSMEDTLRVGDHILVEKASYSPVLGRLLFSGYHPVRKSDIVVFRPPGERDKDHVKRCVAVEGDKFAIRDGAVFVNGERLNEPYAKGNTIIWDENDRISGVVPKGHVVLLGDNRQNSLDSRHYGYVKTDTISGRICAIYWNMAEFKRLDFSRFGPVR